MDGIYLKNQKTISVSEVEKTPSFWLVPSWPPKCIPNFFTLLPCQSIPYLPKLSQSSTTADISLPLDLELLKQTFLYYITPVTHDFMSIENLRTFGEFPSRCNCPSSSDRPSRRCYLANPL